MRCRGLAGSAGGAYSTGTAYAECSFLASGVPDPMMEPAGVGLDVRGRAHVLRATPEARTVPTIWWLGSSDYSARLAAQKGLPYVFAHHFSGRGTAEALDLYRSEFRPSPELEAPRTFLTVNAAVAPSREEAERLARPQLLQMVALRTLRDGSSLASSGTTGSPLTPQPLVEEAEKVELPGPHQELLEAMRERWVIGTPGEAAEALQGLAATYDVDEVMVNPVGGAYTGTDPAQSPAREQTLRLLAEG